MEPSSISITGGMMLIMGTVSNNQRWGGNDDARIIGVCLVCLCWKSTLFETNYKSPWSIESAIVTWHLSTWEVGDAMLEQIPCMLYYGNVHAAVGTRVRPI